MARGLARAWWWLIRFGFRLLYNELAWTYDLVSRVVSLGQWRSWQRAGLQRLGAVPGQRVLELAHGTGNMQIDLAAEGLASVGVDLSAAMGRIARRKLRRQGLMLCLVRCRAQRLPFAARQFDAILSTFPTEFIVAPETLAEAYRVLKPGGRMVVVVSGILTAGGPTAGTLEWLYRVTGQRGPWLGDPLGAFHNVGFAVEAVTEMLPRGQVLLLVATRDQDEL
jgi:ubiquinone/menaquinone biosynthesis C-methylase UbiE